MAKKPQIWNPEWDKNRRIIKASLNEEEQQRMIRKYGVVLSSSMLKDIIFSNNVIVRSVIRDETKEELVFQLKKMGNNLNQIAWKINSNYDVDPVQVTELLNKINQLIA